MPKLKLTYFDVHGGRGEPARLALSIGRIPFEDDRAAPSDWPARKPNTPFGALPVLEVDGETLAQSNAINRYVGKLTDLMVSPADHCLAKRPSSPRMKRSPASAVMDGNVQYPVAEMRSMNPRKADSHSWSGAGAWISARTTSLKPR